MPKIISVKIIKEPIIVKGNTLNSHWRGDMQKIETDPPADSKEKFYIDNMPGRTFGKCPVGFDWSTKIGQVVQAETVTYLNEDNKTSDKILSWLQSPKPKLHGDGDNLLTTSKLATKLGITKKVLDQKLIDVGYLEKQDDKLVLTSQGKDAGGQPRISKQFGPFFMWPADLVIPPHP